MATRKRNRPGRQTQRQAQKVYASVGRFTTIKDDGTLENSNADKLRMAGLRKTADLFAGPTNAGANITDSNNIGYYSFEFPVDSLEQPQSRAQELRFYRLAYDRDPIVGRGIDLHTEIPMSKITLERPKCSSEAFADYIYDFYQQLVTNTRLFETLLHASREYWTIGEAFLYIEDSSEVPVCKEAQPYVESQDTDEKRNSGGGTAEIESYNPSWGATSLSLSRRSSLKKEIEVLTHQKIGSSSDTADSLGVFLEKFSKVARIVTRKHADDDAPPPPEGGDDLGGGSPDMSGGGLMPPPPDSMDMGMGMEGEGGPPEDKETLELRRYLKLLEKKRTLLEELESLQETRDNDMEMFKHIANKNYTGFEQVQLLPPENIEIKKSEVFGGGPTIFYRPPEDQKQSYIASDETPEEVKDSLQSEGLIPLNDDPFKGSYIVHFARKKAPFEDHGRSVLQRCMRTIIYREKLRQVQTTIASRNMTPKSFIVAPEVSAAELMNLRAHIDEAKADPDFSVIVNYEARWDEIGSEGRLLALDSEWQHTATDLAIGLGFSPDVLNGEGLYSGTKIQLEILSTTYTQYRDLVSWIVQELLFKPVAMKKGFFETDKYGRPRWIYPSVTFGRMALKNSGDVYQMLFDLYQKGSIPISLILDLLDVDPETCKKQLEEDLFSVNDSKFNTFLESLYSSIGTDDKIKNSTDLMDRIYKTLGLKEKEQEDSEIEGSGEGM